MSETPHEQLDGATARTPAPSRAWSAAEPELVWSLGWSVALGVTAAAALAAVTEVSMTALLALLVAAIPALIGARWRPKGRAGVLYVGLWALSMMAAGALAGGLGGPLTVWCVMPVAVALVIEAPLVLGGVCAGGALLGVALLGLVHLTGPQPTPPVSFWLTFAAVVAALGGVIGGVRIAQRRAARRQAEIEAELAAFQTLMGDLPELAVAMDASGRAHAVFGRPLAGLDVEALHRSLFDIAVQADWPKLHTALNQAIETGYSAATFTPTAVGDHRIAVVLQRTSIGGLTAILREAPSAPDVPAQLVQRAQDAEAARDKAEADATGRARFLANMSHELRTPLNAIMGFSDIMRNQMFGELRPKYAEYAELIHESGRHLLDLINDVLDISKIEADRYELSLEVFDVREAVNAALRLVRLQADEADIRLRGVLPAEALMVDADRRALKQIVLNLVSNALKFTPAGGQITVTADQSGGELDLVVADTGMGIAPEDLARLGRPYEQAGGANERSRGTGLGLSLVRAFAELHGGRMAMESRLGEGTAVSVRLPVLIPAEWAPEPAARAPASPSPPSTPAMPKVAPGGVPDAPES